MCNTRFSLILASVILAGCVENQALLGEAGEREATACESEQIVQFVNASSTDAAAIKAIGVASTGANNVISQRNGADGLVGTADDQLYSTFQQIDAVSGIGDSSVAAFLAYAEAACAGVEEEEEDDAPCGEDAFFDWLNASTTTADVIKAIGISSTASNNIVTYRKGSDGLAGTSDDRTIDDWAELDSISYVGAATLADFQAYAATLCDTGMEVMFSPAASWSASHLPQVVAEIDAAQSTIDIAMYSFSDATISSALEKAVDRGVTVRMIFETAAADVKVTSGSTKSSRLEDIGVDVRYVNKVMHHKFVIIDGPRNDASLAESAVLVSGSANWSNSAATVYNENTVFAHGDERLVLEFQQEFNKLWAYSRPYDHNTAITYVPNGVEITDAMIAAAEGSDAVFTSANMKTSTSSTYGGTFSKVRGRYTVSDQLVALIQGADTSIDIATTHLRSRPIAEALMEKHLTDPDVEIRLYLDGQEYLAYGTNEDQKDDLEDCLVAAGTSANAIQDCYDYGFLFAYDVYEAGVPLRFQYYAYRWDYAYSKQMHSKYMIVDGETVATGSYNYSVNSELGTLENVMILSADRYPEIVEAYQADFEKVWATGESSGLYAEMMAELQAYADAQAAAKANGTTPPTGKIDIVFPSMGITQPEVYALKNLILRVCPDVNSDEYRDNPTSHLYCSF